MGLFKKKQVEEVRNYNSVLEALTSNNIYISKNSINKIPVVRESINKIAGTLASLPIELLKKEENKNTFINDDRLYLLNIENNTYSTSYQYKYKIVEDLLLYGKHYSYIERKGTKIIGLYPIEHSTVSERDVIDNNGIIIDKVINYTLNNMIQSKNAYEILIIDTGNKGILNSNNVLELALKHDNMMSKVLDNIAMPSGYLKSNDRLTNSTIQKMRESWKNLYTGSQNMGKTIILEEGLEYKTFDIDLSKLQSNDNKKQFTDDIKRLFGLYDIKSDSEYLKYTLTPIISAIENALSSQLLLTSEKENNIKFIINTEEVARASEKERIEALTMAINSGILTINEARTRLNENPFILDSKKDFLSVSQGKIMLFPDSTLTIPNMGTVLNAEGKKEGESNGETI